MNHLQGMGTDKMEVITIKDIARLSGVGVSTVSRAINNHPDINQETKAKIMEVIKEYNYVPNNSARNLKRSESKTVAVMIKGISNPFFGKMIKIFEEEIQKKKYSFIIQHVREREDEIDAAIQLEKEKRLKGIIFLGGYFTHSHEKLMQLKVPFVLSTIGLTGQSAKEEYASVSVDDVKESYRIVDYLCNIGHKKIAIIAASEDDESIGKLRIEGYRKALKDHGITVNPKLIGRMKEEIESYSMENGYLVAKELLESKEEFTAIYGISDSLAIGACRALREYGKNVPEDCSVAGFDGLELGSYYMPSLTTVRQPVEDMAHATIQLLFRFIGKKETKQKYIFPAELVIRESTKEL